MTNLREALLNTLPGGWQSRQLYIGEYWTLSLVQNATGEQRAGVAATSSAEDMAAQSRFQYGEILTFFGPQFQHPKLAYHRL